MIKFLIRLEHDDVDDRPKIDPIIVDDRPKIDPIVVEKPNSVRASCSLNPTTPVTPSSDESVECLLFIDDTEFGGTIHVANGRAYMNGGVVHFSPLEEGNLRVAVLGVLIKKAKLPIPTEEAQTIEDAIGGFVSWPKRLIEVDTGIESRGPVVKQLSKLGFESEASIDDAKKIPYKVINPKYRLLAQHANKVMLPEGDVIMVNVSPSLAAIPIPVSFEDISDFLQYLEIGAGSITVYME